MRSLGAIQADEAKASRETKLMQFVDRHIEKFGKEETLLVLKDQADRLDRKTQEMVLFEVNAMLDGDGRKATKEQVRKQIHKIKKGEKNNYRGWINPT